MTNQMLRRIPRGLGLTIVGSLVIGISGVYLPDFQVLMTFLFAYFATAILHREEIFNGEFVSGYLWLLTLGVFVSGGLLAKYWHLAVCQFLIDPVKTSSDCGVGDINSTALTGIAVPLVWVMSKFLALLAGCAKRRKDRK